MSINCFRSRGGELGKYFGYGIRPSKKISPDNSLDTEKVSQLSILFVLSESWVLIF